MNKNTCILVNKSNNGDNNIQCMRRLILGIVLTGSRIRWYGKMFKDGDRWHGHSWRHRLVDGTRFFFRYSLMFSHSNLFSFSLISGNSHALYKLLQVWKCLRISSSFTQLPECSVMHFESLRPTDYCISCPPDGA